LEHLRLTRYSALLVEVENECISYNLARLPSLWQKLSELVEFSRSYDKNNFA